MAIDSTLAKVFARRRARLGEPPSADALADFRAGRLSKDERERLLEYASVDPETAQTLLDAIRFPNLEPGEDDTVLSDEDLQYEWQRFRDKLKEENKVETTVVPVDPPRKTRSTRFLSLAATALLAAGLAFFAANLRRTDVTPSVHPLILTLTPDGSTRSQTSEAFADEAELAVLRLMLEHAEPFASYRVVLRDAAGKAVWDAELTPEKVSELTISVPRTLLAPGLWRCELIGIDRGEERVTIATYSFRIDS